MEKFDLYFKLGLDNELSGLNLVTYCLFMIRAFPDIQVSFKYSIEWIERFKVEKFPIKYMDNDKLVIYHEIHKTLINLMGETALIL